MPFAVSEVYLKPQKTFLFFNLFETKQQSPVLGSPLFVQELIFQPVIEESHANTLQFIKKKGGQV